MWLCNNSYDAISGLMENAACFSSTGSASDPVPGQTTASFANCQGQPVSGTCSSTSGCTSVSAGFQSEDAFGQGAYTIPVYSASIRYGYLLCPSSANNCTPTNSWTRVINSGGTFNYFNWLNAWNANSGISGTIRQGLSGNTHSLNPYIAESPQDIAIISAVYDTLFVADPYNDLQYVNWMTMTTTASQSVSYSGGLGPPPGTVATYRFSLRPDLTWQDGTQVTAFDVAFSYLSLFSTGSFLGGTLAPVTGITILSPTRFDIGVNSLGVFLLPSITAVPILPGRYWTSVGSSLWDSDVATCTGNNNSCYPTQYTDTGVNTQCTFNCNNFHCTPTSGCNMVASATDISAGFDPVAKHVFVGSGPWQCGRANQYGSGGSSGTCTTDGTMAPFSGGYTLIAFPNYFRSSQRLAIYLWSGESDTNAVGPSTAVGSCYGVAVNLAGPCGHYQQGAGNPGSGTPVSVTTVGNVDIFFNLNWLAPFEWTTSPPTGIAPLPPLLYGPGTTFTPNPGGSSCTTPNSYYDC
jgi:hypothetical protein